MSGRKRTRAAEAEPSGLPAAKKRGVTLKTAEKWVVEYDRELNTTVWLKFDVADRDRVVALKCAVCTQFRAKLEGMRNYRSSLIYESTNVKTSTFKEHAVTDMHARAMALYKKEQSTSMYEYAPIARALTNIPMDDGSREKLRRKLIL